MMTFLAPASTCLRAVGGLGEEARRLDDDVDPEVGPGQRRRVPLGQDLEGAVANLDAVLGGPHGFRIAAQNAVVLQQMRHRRHIAKIVRRDDLEVGPGCLHGAEEVPADPAESVDAHTNGHCCGSLLTGGLVSRYG